MPGGAFSVRGCFPCLSWQGPASGRVHPYDVHAEALQDLRACELLETLAGREFVMECIEEDLAEPLTFKRFPKSDYYLLALRNRINREIAKRI